MTPSTDPPASPNLPVAIRRVGLDEVLTAQWDAVAEPAQHWAARVDVDYFGIVVDDRLVGQILLHDVDATRQEALVAYHIFRAQDRGRGYGTRALTALAAYVARETDLARLIIITSADNTASQALARRCGFRDVGPPREDPTGVVFELTIPADGLR